MVPKLKNMIGEFIFLSLVSGPDLVKVKLIGVEFGGIWIEHKKLSEGFLSMSESKMLPNTPIVFIPYSALKSIIAALGVPLIDETLLDI